MDALDQLRAAARDRRDEAMQHAQDQYQQTIRTLKSVERRLRKPRRRKPRYNGVNKGEDFSKLTTKRAAELVLCELGPLSLGELVIEVQRRGCRPHDEPRIVGHAINSSLSYHKGRFSRDGEGRWAVVELITKTGR